MVLINPRFYARAAGPKLASLEVSVRVRLGHLQTGVNACGELCQGVTGL